jgi:hypothetical protein
VHFHTLHATRSAARSCASFVVCRARRGAIAARLLLPAARRLPVSAALAARRRRGGGGELRQRIVAAAASRSAGMTVARQICAPQRRRKSDACVDARDAVPDAVSMERDAMTRRDSDTARCCVARAGADV